MLDPTTAPSGRLLIDNVHKSFAGVAGELPVLRGITLDIQAGEFVSIVGGSGCGKSTLLRAVAGIEGIDSGRLLLDGSSIVRPGIDRGSSLSGTPTYALAHRGRKRGLRPQDTFQQ
jgi:ABC-type Fe3+/spermidine/putrescine transport system ATPase subunit